MPLYSIESCGLFVNIRINKTLQLLHISNHLDGKENIESVNNVCKPPHLKATCHRSLHIGKMYKAGLVCWHQPRNWFATMATYILSDMFFNRA